MTLSDEGIAEAMRNSLILLQIGTESIDPPNTWHEGMQLNELIVGVLKQLDLALDVIATMSGKDRSSINQAWPLMVESAINDGWLKKSLE